MSERHLGIIKITNESLLKLLGLSKDHTVHEVKYLWDQDALEVKVEGPDMPGYLAGQHILRVGLQVQKPALTEID